MKLVSTRDVETRRAPEEWFTGAVWIGGTSAGSPPDAGIFRVFFEPGTRTNWHTHPEGRSSTSSPEKGVRREKANRPSI